MLQSYLLQILQDSFPCVKCKLYIFFFLPKLKDARSVRGRYLTIPADLLSTKEEEVAMLAPESKDCVTSCACKGVRRCLLCEKRKSTGLSEARVPRVIEFSLEMYILTLNNKLRLINFCKHN